MGGWAVFVLVSGPGKARFGDRLAPTTQLPDDRTVDDQIKLVCRLVYYDLT
jgi:hypothetical protein